MPYRIPAGFGMSTVFISMSALTWHITCTASYHPGMDSHSIAAFIDGFNVVRMSLTLVVWHLTGMLY